MPKILAYLSHPVGVGNGKDLLHRQDNIANAVNWLNFLTRATRWAIAIPWFPYVAADVDKPRGLVDNLVTLERCDVVLQCGGMISTHMVIERTHAERRAIPAIDLTDLGTSPPWERVGTSELAAMLRARARDVESKQPRAVWMPPLSRGEIDGLRQLVRQLGDSGDNASVRDTLNSIVATWSRFVGETL